MGGLSYEAAGLSNYITKRDWRRYGDRELRAEGNEGLYLNVLVAKNIQVTPAGSTFPLTLICEARRGDGKRTVVAGNQTTLWAYTGTEDTHYVLNSEGQPDYFSNTINGPTPPDVPVYSGGGDNFFSNLVSGQKYTLTFGQNDNAAKINNQVYLGPNPVTFTAGPGPVTLFGKPNLPTTAQLTAPYVDENQYGWIQIASGLSASGRRWEAVSVGDYICLNNGVDLPLTFRPGDQSAFPIYELREQQIACVGTIASHVGNLLCMDITSINDAPFAALMAPVTGAVDAGMDVTGLISVPAQTLFPDATVTVGLTIFWASGQAAKIISIDGDGNITTAVVQAIPSGPVYLENPLAYAAYVSNGNTQRYPWRMLPSMPGAPRRFGATVPVSANLFDRQLIFQYPIRSLPELLTLNLAGGFSVEGQIGGTTDIQVLYAGQGGITLTTSVIGIQDGIAMSCLIFDPILSPISDTGNVNENTVSSIEAADAADSYAGAYTDLVGDGSAILKALQLQTQIIVYKETGHIFLGVFTGDITNPYQFQDIEVHNQGQCLRYRNVVIGSGGGFYGSCHVYAGRNAFYKFDLFMQTPQEIPELQPAQDLFFQASIADPENAYVAENPLTTEWVFGWDLPGADRALCFDYTSRTCRTTSMTMASACKIQHPNPARNDWLFLFGSDDGTVQRYGLWDAKPQPSGAVTVSVTGIVATASAAFFTVDHVGMSILAKIGDCAELVAITGYTSPTQVTVLGSFSTPACPLPFYILPATWHRNGLPYDSILESGLGDLGSSDMEKQVIRYVPIAGSKLQWDTVDFPPFPTLLNLAFKGAINPTAKPDWEIETTASEPHNLVEPTYQAFYVGDKVCINAINAPYALVNRIWQSKAIGSQSAGRV